MTLTHNTEQLKAHLKTQHQAKFLDTLHFSFPLHTVTVHYHPIIKTPMDILMKMMLISFNRAPIKATEVLANILLVEPLFIEDLTKKMQASEMIEKDDEGIYRLTDKGLSQLNAGVYEEQLELVTEEILYSDIHKDVLAGDIEAIYELEELPEPLSYAEEKLTTLHEERVIKKLQENLAQITDEDDADDTQQAFITKLEAYEAQQIQDIPFDLFILQDEKDGRLFARVYNSFTQEWDEALEHFIQENERASWQQRYNIK